MPPERKAEFGNYSPLLLSETLANSLSPIKSAHETAGFVGSAPVSITWVDEKPYLPEVMIDDIFFPGVSTDPAQKRLKVRGVFREPGNDGVIWRVSANNEKIFRLINQPHSELAHSIFPDAQFAVLAWNRKLSAVADHRNRKKSVARAAAVITAAVALLSWASATSITSESSTEVHAPSASTNPKHSSAPSTTQASPSLAPTPSQTASQTPIEKTKTVDFDVATWNIRAARLHASAWDTARRNAVLDFIKTVDIIGLQETQRELTNVKPKNQIKNRDNSEAWLTQKLEASGYARTTPTVSPRYGAKKPDDGEDRIIFFRTDTFTLIDQGNETLANHRNLPWVELKVNATGQKFYFLDTHLSHSGSTNKYSPTRGRQIRQILRFVDRNLTDLPIIFLGDMNSHPDSKEAQMIEAGGFANTFTVADEKQHIDQSSTLSGFKGGLSGTAHKGGMPIDQIFIMDGSKTEISIPDVEIDVDRYGSDHFPVETTVSLKS